MSEERARAINTLREIAQALESDQSTQAVEILGAVGPEPENGRPSAAQLSYVALQSLDDWYAKHGLNGRVRVVQRDVPRTIRNITPAIEALAAKGRALRSTPSLLQRNPEQAVAGASAFVVTAALRALSKQHDTDFDAQLNQLLPEQEVSEPPAPIAPAVTETEQAAPVAEIVEDVSATVVDDVVEVIDETAQPSPANTDDPAARYTAIVETRFMAGVKEFVQWMGDGHAVTGTGLPKRADIKDVAATIGIDAEGVAKKPEEAPQVASDLDLNLAAEVQPTRYATSAQAIPELMAFWTTLQETGQAQVNSTKIQPGDKAAAFAFEDAEQLDAAEELVATYVAQTLTYDAGEAAAKQTAQFILDADAADIEGVLIPRLRQLEAMDLLEITDGQPVIPAALQPAVTKGATQILN